MKILIYAMGSGESSQAYALSRKFVQKGHQISLVIRGKERSTFFSKDNEFSSQFSSQIVTTPLDFINLVNSQLPDGLILCNSKLFAFDAEVRQYITRYPFKKKIVTCTLDSNWLFNPSSHLFAFITWADRYFVNLPQKIFDLGLKKNGGYFSIPDKYLNKISTIGLIPSYEKPDLDLISKTRNRMEVNQSEKVIFCYFSGIGGADARPWLFDKLLYSVLKINQEKGIAIKILPIGNLALIQDKIKSHSDIIINHKPRSLDDFYLSLASCDLVFQHQGLATMAQAITAQVPVISNVSIYQGDEYPGLHPAEVGPFVKAGLCIMVYKDTENDKVKEAVNQLLFDENTRSTMKKAQMSIYSSGENNLINEFEKLFTI